MKNRYSLGSVVPAIVRHVTASILERFGLRHRGPSVLLILILLFFSLSAYAQVPGILNYQGRVTVNGTNFDGMGQFKFALVNGTGTATFWSNGTSAVSVPVTKGLYSVLLGDTTIPNMATGVPAVVFTNTDVRLRVWFNGQQLSPDQRIGASGYALMAGKIADGTISNANLSALTLSNTFWRLSGNVGTTPGTHFIGTTDNQPLEVKVNGIRALRLELNGSGAPNLVGGAPVNAVGAGVVGATIGGGGATNYSGFPYTNRVDADFGTIGGGYGNGIQINAYDSTIGGGQGNSIQTNAFLSTIGGGHMNNIQTLAYCATISGGEENSIGYDATHAAIGGGNFNDIQDAAWYATIAGGKDNNIQTLAHRSTIGGGSWNSIQTNAACATISGGEQNSIQSNAPYATIGGGEDNSIQYDADHATIGGGKVNSIQILAYCATISGGEENRIGYDATHATIGGGNLNTIQDFAWYGTIGGGYNNNIQPGAYRSMIGGGSWNSIKTNAIHSTIGGGYQNTINGGGYSTVPGGRANSATGTYSFAAGRRAKANHDGAFVWGDSTDTDISSSTSNQVTFRAWGGYRIYTASGVGVQVASGGNAWSAMSDRNVKENFATVNPETVLEKVAALPVTTWNMKTQDPSIRHLGPMAQDFRAAFGLGEDERYISTSDADGVALAAIQGLYLQLQAEQKALQAEKARNDALEQRVEELEARIR